MTAATKNDILELGQKVIIDQVTEDGKTFHFLDIGSDGRDEWEEETVHRNEFDEDGNPIIPKVKLKGLRAWLLAKALCDAGGVLLFTDHAEGQAACGKLPSKVSGTLFNAIKELNGLDLDALKNAKKNSSDTPNSSDGTN